MTPPQGPPGPSYRHTPQPKKKTDLSWGHNRTHYSVHVRVDGYRVPWNMEFLDMGKFYEIFCLFVCFSLFYYCIYFMIIFFLDTHTHCTLHTAHCTLHTAHCTLHTAHCTLHTAHCTLHTAHCTLHTAHWIYGRSLTRDGCGIPVTVLNCRQIFDPRRWARPPRPRGPPRRSAGRTKFCKK